MQLQEYLINDVKPLSLSTRVADLQTIFNQLTYSHLPVVENGSYLGCVSETDAHCFLKDETLKELKYALVAFQVEPQVQWLDALEVFARHQTNILPVIDDKSNYLGYYELKDVMALFNDTPFMHELGTVVVVEKGTTDFTVSEIAQIVESNDAKLHGVFVSNQREHFTEITLKVSNHNLNQVLQTFRRYGYEIVNAAQHDVFMDTLKERSEYLDRYLNI
ncbi:MAG: CBS domain-containing protein [Nonlabens sp.]